MAWYPARRTPGHRYAPGARCTWRRGGLPEHFQRMLDHLYTNGDGALDKAEVDAAAGGEGRN